ncbi:MAG: hypothetical protein WBQ50_03205 [Nocardioides sp.]
MRPYVVGGAAHATKGQPDLDDGLGWHTTAKGQVWTMQKPYGALTWFPVNGRLSDKAFFDVRLAVLKKSTGVSKGRLVDKASRPGYEVMEW